MAKNTLGKLIAFTTTVAAIGGVCYVFRDKIKESPLFKTASDKANDIYNNIKTKMNSDDDFFFDDWDDDFEDDYDDSANLADNNSREYTSITPSSGSDIDDTLVSNNSEDNTDSIEVSDSIPTIDFGSSFDNNTSEESSPEKYENEGLSDTSEDPDVLEEQDKLDF